MADSETYHHPPDRPCWKCYECGFESKEHSFNCYVCKGTGRVKPLFEEIECGACSGVGKTCMPYFRIWYYSTVSGTAHSLHNAKKFCGACVQRRYQEKLDAGWHKAFFRIVAFDERDYDFRAGDRIPPWEELVLDLTRAIEYTSMPPGGLFRKDIKRVLIGHVNNAKWAFFKFNVPESDKLRMACWHLSQFVNEVEAQSGKKLSQHQASDLINRANAIKAIFECP
jgi:hypothetical protein